MCINQFGSLEIGRDSFFEMISQPEISSSLSDHGESCRVTIRCPLGGPFPKPGFPAFIVRNGIKEFGGVYQSSSETFFTDRVELALSLESYKKDLERKKITNYSRLDTLTGHVGMGLVLGNAFVPGFPLNLIKPAVLVETGDFFQFDFVGPGSLTEFIVGLCGITNCDYNVVDSGAIRVLSITGSFAFLKIFPTNIVIDPAPYQILDVPGPGDPICTHIPGREVFYFDLQQDRGIPLFSMFTVVGKNGINRPDDTTRTKTEFVDYLSDGTIGSEPLLATADRVVSIELNPA